MLQCNILYESLIRTFICLQHSSSKYGIYPDGAFEEFGNNNLREWRKLYVEAQSMVEKGKR